MLEQTKKCSKCGEVKARSEFHKHNQKKDGLQPRCKHCRRPKTAVERDTLRDSGLKKCSKCKDVKTHAEFHKSKSSKDGLGSSCKACVSELSTNRYAENAEAYRAYNARYREENKVLERDRKAAWYRKNKAKARATRQRRRARLANAQGDHTAEQLKARFDYHGNKCVYCNSTEDLHADHQIPLIRGGANFASNIVPACANCNISKGTKTPIEFADYTFKQLQAMLGK